MYAARAGLAHPCRSDGAMRMAVADSVFKKIKNSARGREMESRKERSVGRARVALSRRTSWSKQGRLRVSKFDTA